VFVCVNHPERDAELICSRCDRWSCDACAKPLTELARGPLGCPSCDGVLRKGQRESEPDTVRQLVDRAICGEGLLTLVALSVPGLLSGFGGAIGVFFNAVYLSTLGGYCFQLMDHVGRYQSGLPFSSEVVNREQLIGNLFRGALSVVACLGPALYVGYHDPDSTLWLALLIIGFLLVPASILSGVLTRSWRNQLWPLVWIQIVAKAPASYLRLVAQLYGSMVLWAMLYLAFAWLFAPLGGAVFLVMPLVHTAFAVWLSLLAASFIQREANTFGSH
jgi:hypothetical protein